MIITESISRIVLVEWKQQQHEAPTHTPVDIFNIAALLSIRNQLTEYLKLPYVSLPPPTPY